MPPHSLLWLLICATVIAAASLLQLLCVLGVLLKVTQLLNRMQPLIDTAERELPELIANSKKLVAETRAKVDAVAANLVEISVLARQQAARADVLIKDFSERLQLQFIRLDEAVGAGLAGFEQVVTTVQTAVLRPVQEFNALVRGLQAGLGFLFRRKSAAAGERGTYQDEEMFI